MKKTISLTFIFALLLFASEAQNIRHDQLQAPEQETSDSIVFYMHDAEGYWRLGKGILDTSMVRYIEAYATIEQLNDSFVVLRGEIPTLLTELDSAGFTLTESQISDLQDYLTSETDPMYSTDSSFIKSGVRSWENSVVYGVSESDTTRWGADGTISGTENYIPKYGVSGLTESGIYEDNDTIKTDKYVKASDYKIGDSGFTLKQQNQGITINRGTRSIFYLNNDGHNGNIGLTYGNGTSGDFYLMQLIGGSHTYRLRVTSDGYFGFNKSYPNYSVDVTGDVNISGVYRINGTPIDAGGGSGGANSFLELLDTPSSYSGQSNKYVRVNSSGNALIFDDVSAGESLWDLGTHGISYNGNIGVGAAASSSVGSYISRNISNGWGSMIYNSSSSNGGGLRIVSNSNSLTNPILLLEGSSINSRRFYFTSGGGFYQNRMTSTPANPESNFGLWYVNNDGKPMFKYGSTTYDLSAMGGGDYELPTMSSTVKGGAKHSPLDGGLMIVNDFLLVSDNRLNSATPLTTDLIGFWDISTSSQRNTTIGELLSLGGSEGSTAESYQTLTSSSSVTFNRTTSRNAKLTMGTNVTLTISNLVNGDIPCILRVYPHSSTNYTLTFPSAYFVNNHSNVFTIEAGSGTFYKFTFETDGTNIAIDYATYSN